MKSAKRAAVHTNGAWLLQVIIHHILWICWGAPRLFVFASYPRCSLCKFSLRSPKKPRTIDYFFPRASERRVLQKEGGVNRSTYKRYLLASSRIWHLLTSSHIWHLLTSDIFSHLTSSHISHLLTSSHIWHLLTSHIFSHLTSSHIFTSDIFSHLTSSRIWHLLTSHIFSHLLTTHVFLHLTSSHIFSHLTSSHISHLLTSHIFSHLHISLLYSFYLRRGAGPADHHERLPSAEIVRVGCAKPRRNCICAGACATLCGDRACRMRET